MTGEKPTLIRCTVDAMAWRHYQQYTRGCGDDQRQSSGGGAGKSRRIASAGVLAYQANKQDEAIGS